MKFYCGKCKAELAMLTEDCCGQPEIIADQIVCDRVVVPEAPVPFINFKLTVEK